jgi:23S rRNA (guanosine2251-2'-O)-methyltransferase
LKTDRKERAGARRDARPARPIDVLYGRNAVREALRAGRRRVYSIFIAAGVRDNEVLGDILGRAEGAGVAVREIERATLDTMAAGAAHHGIIAEASTYPYVELGELLDRAGTRQPPALFLLLDYVQDPQNLGTLIRTAEALAVDGVVIPRHRAAGVTAAVVTASAGAAEHMRVAEVPSLPGAMGALKDAGVWVIGLDQGEGAALYTQTRLTDPTALVVGAEGPGMSRLVRERCDQLMQLPMLGRIDSLNAAVAGSVALYEVWRQRAAKAGEI